jgi:flagellar biosynthesis protein FlhB
MSDKTEAPTPRRLAKAREKGEVAVSAAASQALGFLVAVLTVGAAVTATASEASSLLRGAIAGSAGWSAQAFAFELVRLVSPWLLVVGSTAAFATFVQTGGLWAPTRLAPDLAKLDPIAGMRSLFSWQRCWNVLRALLAALVVGFLAWRELRYGAADLAHSVGHTSAAVGLAGHAALRIARQAAFVGLGLGLLDLVIVRQSFLSKQKMSKAEVKREHRESEGDPQLKAARHRSHQEMLNAASIQAVRDASVLVVNPEHLAIALRYVDGEDDAPRVLANEAGELAQRMQDAARAWGVPIVRDVPVARALRELEVGDTIPEALYEAVAEILREAWAEEEASGVPREPSAT